MSWQESKDAVLCFLVSSSYFWVIYEMRRMSRIIAHHEEKHEDINRRLGSLEQIRRAK